MATVVSVSVIQINSGDGAGEPVAANEQLICGLPTAGMTIIPDTSVTNDTNTSTCRISYENSTRSPQNVYWSDTAVATIIAACNA